MWFHRFQNDPNRSCSDEPHRGRPRSARTPAAINSVQAAVQQDRRKSIKDIANEAGTSWSTAQRILKKELHLRHLAPKFIPKILTQAQKVECVRICRANLQKVQLDARILDRIITMDESWVFKFDPNTKQVDMQWIDPQGTRPTKALRAWSTNKCMLCLFFDVKGVIFMEFLDCGECLNSDLYIAILRRVREAIRRKRPQLWRDQNFLIHQDNAPCHVSIQMAEYFHSVDQDLWPHPPYSPDLAPCDFWAFPALKKQLRGIHFEDLDDLQDMVRCHFRELPQEVYQDAFNTMALRYGRCIQAGGEYFEA